MKDQWDLYKKVIKKYPDIRVVELHSESGFNPGVESGNLSSLIRWFPSIVVIDKSEYDMSRGVSGYRYKSARIFGSKYKRGERPKTPKRDLTVDDFKLFVADIFGTSRTKHR